MHDLELVHCVYLPSARFPLSVPSIRAGAAGITPCSAPVQLAVVCPLTGPISSPGLTATGAEAGDIRPTNLHHNLEAHDRSPASDPTNCSAKIPWYSPDFAIRSS